MVVAVVNKIVWNGMSVVGVELLEQGLGHFLLVFLNLNNEAAGLLGAERMNVVPLKIDVLEAVEFVDLIQTNGSLIFPPIRYLNGFIHHVGLYPIL